MNSETFDVVILGGGNAGIGVTGPVRRAGMSVAMIEARDLLGGTCPNRGCTPKKVLVAAGHALHEIERAAVHHIAVGKPRLDWAALIDREKDMIKDIPANLARSMAQAQRRGDQGPRRVRRSQPGPRRQPRARSQAYRDRDGLKAAAAADTGRRTHDHLGRDAERTRAAGFSDLRRRRRDLAGIRPCLCARRHRGHDPRRRCRNCCRRWTPTPSPVSRPRASGSAFASRPASASSASSPPTAGCGSFFTHDGAEQAAEADRVVNGAGRVANVDTLDLAAGQVEHANGRVALDRHLRSVSNPLVHVCGDAVPISPQLSPIATYEGDIVGRNIVEGPKYSPDYASMATSVYTVPALAAVGLTEAAARQKGFAIDVHANDMQDWFSAKTYAETVAWSKIIVDRATDRILGAHFVGHAGQELVNLFGLAMRFGITAGQIKDNVYAYPTFSSDIKHMLGHV